MHTCQHLYWAVQQCMIWPAWQYEICNARVNTRNTSVVMLKKVTSPATGPNKTTWMRCDHVVLWIIRKRIHAPQACTWKCSKSAWRQRTTPEMCLVGDGLQCRTSSHMGIKSKRCSYYINIMFVQPTSYPDCINALSPQLEERYSVVKVCACVHAYRSSHKRRIRNYLSQEIWGEKYNRILERSKCSPVVLSRRWTVWSSITYLVLPTLAHVNNFIWACTGASQAWVLDYQQVCISKKVASTMMNASINTCIKARNRFSIAKSSKRFADEYVVHVDCMVMY